MEHLVSLDGKWTPDLIELMIPRAVELRLHRVADMTKAVISALGSMFSKDAIHDLNDQILYIESLLLAQAYEARGIEPPKSGVLHPKLAKMTRTMGGMDSAFAESEPERKKDPRLTKRSTRRTD